MDSGQVAHQQRNMSMWKDTGYTQETGKEAKLKQHLPNRFGLRFLFLGGGQEE